MLRVIFFDLDETLVAQEHAFEQAYRSTAEWLAREVLDAEPTVLASTIPTAAERALGASPLAATIRRCRFGGRDLLWGNPGTGADATQAIAEQIEAFRAAVWDMLLEGYPVGYRSWTRSSLATELNRRFRAAMFDALCLYPDVRPALDRLARSYDLAVITNGLGTAQREKLVHFGIDRHFRSVIASAEVGVGKPARQIFAGAMRALDVGADEAMMIGDSLEGDVEGAIAAGMRALWLNRHERPSSGQRSQISSLEGWSPSSAATLSPNRTPSESA